MFRINDIPAVLVDRATVCFAFQIVNSAIRSQQLFASFLRHFYSSYSFLSPDRIM